MATEVYLVRHGETMFNQLNKVQGWADSPLTVKGINDLKVTGSNLSQVHFDKMYSSDFHQYNRFHLEAICHSLAIL